MCALGGAEIENKQDLDICRGRSGVDSYGIMGQTMVFRQALQCGQSVNIIGQGIVVAAGDDEPEIFVLDSSCRP